LSQTNPKVYSLEDLAGLTGLPRRTVRYYIQLGLVDRPIGETRAAYYTATHLDQLLTVHRYAQEGFSLERIAELLQAPQTRPTAPRAGAVEVRSHLTVADGVDLVIEPGRARLSPEQVRDLFKKIMGLYRTIVEEKPE
jgi:DNA-binding transcriptional MerR regulator